MADDLNRLARGFRSRARALAYERARDRCHELGIRRVPADGVILRILARDFIRAKKLNLTRPRDLARDLDLNRDLERALDLGSLYNQDHDAARALVQVATAVRRRSGGVATDRSWAGMSGFRVLGCLARLLPADERGRFVAEAQGNLADCEHWWQRIDHLVCLAIGMPRLAAMLWRENGRRRA